MNFIAIDFETANFKRSSACSVGIAIVSNGTIVKRFSHYIKPIPGYFEPINIGVHHIRPEMVKDSPSFVELWDTIYPMIQGYPLVAHNAPFDKSVLRASIEAYGKDCPDFEFYCTHKLSKKLLPGLVNYRLSTVCDEFGLSLNHHEAMSDAENCANIVLELARRNGAADLYELLEMADGDKKKGHTVGNAPATLFATNVLTSIKKDDSSIFNKKIVVFTGRLKRMVRKDAEKIVEMLGGIPKSSVVNGTNFLISGIQDQTKDSGKSGKEKKAEELLKKGNDLEILDENDFIEYTLADFLSFEVTPGIIREDSELLLNRNKLNDLSGCKVFFGGCYSMPTPLLCQLVGNSGGTGLPIELSNDSDLEDADYVVFSSNTIDTIKSGEKDTFTLLVEAAVRQKLINAGSASIRMISEDAFLRYMEMRKAHVDGIAAMKIHEWDVDERYRIDYLKKEAADAKNDSQNR